MELLLIRHAVAERAPAPGAAADPPLGAPGREQARRLAEWLAGERVDALYTSPLRRARETAGALAQRLGLCPATEPGVAEFERGGGAYLPLEELRRADPQRWRALVRGGAYAEGDVAGFRRGVVAAFERVIAAHPGRRVAVVCHGGVINAWLSHLLEHERLFLFEPLYTGVSRFLAARSGERSLRSLNEAPHLREPL
jgi:probable phosphoglycerate mutase